MVAGAAGYYEKEGLKVSLQKTAGWAVVRDKVLAKEFDASHMLSPMPLALTMGLGATPTPMVMPVMENTNGNAITLHVKHQNNRDPKNWKGFKFAVPFDYSMHNFLLRYYLAENGINPDTDVQIRVVPPPEMVANLRSGNIDGFLGPDPFNQRAVFDEQQQVSHYAAIFTDLSQIRATEAEMAFLADHDELTHLPNRHLFLQLVEQALKVAHREQHNCAVLMLDLDHFKDVNDSYGHPEGDNVLQRIAECGRGSLRRGDLFGRIGGEEFAAVVPGCTPALAMQVAERLQREIQRLSFSHEEQVFGVTVSQGLTELTDEDVALDSLYARADAAMYQAKRQGKNQIVRG